MIFMSLKKIITHDGNFHADEILAIVMLQRIFGNTDIVRTRNRSLIESLLKTNTVLAVVDVYDKEDNELFFDHHQRGFSTKIDILCSSAGLVYKKYAARLFPSISALNSSRCQKILYDKYIKHIDAVDNGIDVKSCYLDNNTEQAIYIRSVSSIVSDFNTFEEALNFVKTDFDNFMLKLHKSCRLYEDVYYMMKKITPNDKILFTKDTIHTTEFISEIEKELGLDVYFSISYYKREYLICAVPVEPDSFACKVPLCENWRGLRDKELCNVAGISGCVFVHTRGFMGINRTLEGAREMCQKSIEYFNNNKVKNS